LVGWFNGAVTSSGQNNGVGGIIKLNEQCSYKWILNCGQGKNTRAELLGACALLTLASRLSILTIHVHGDSKATIDWLTGKGRLQVVTLDYWKHRLRGLIDIFHSISFAHVYREDNEVADNLSK
jgi:ribonuclease HI